MYDNQMIQLIDQTAELAAGEIRVIYLDKNHNPQSSIDFIVRKINKQMPYNIRYSKIYITPTITKPKIKDFPFSYHFMAQVFANAVTRRHHPIYESRRDLNKVLCFAIFFLNNNRGLQFDQLFVNRLRLDSTISVPLVNEDIRLHEYFSGFLDRCLEKQAAKSYEMLDYDDPDLDGLILHVIEHKRAYGKRLRESKIKRVILQ